MTATIITNINKVETNPFADRDKSFDGGGYAQPEITLTLENGGKVVISDSSCGAFGVRYSAEYTDADGVKLASYFFDGVKPFGEDIEESGDFYRFPDVAAAVKAAAGYNLT